MLPGGSIGRLVDLANLRISPALRRTKGLFGVGTGAPNTIT